MDRVEFVIGNTLFALLHKMSHVLIAEMNLPVLGREEDAADTYIALQMLKIGTSFSQHMIADAAKNWFFRGRHDQEIMATPLYYDGRNLDQQRAYQVVCLMVGSTRLIQEPRRSGSHAAIAARDLQKRLGQGRGVVGQSPQASSPRPRATGDAD